MVKKIVIAGTSVYGIGNLGDEALLKVLVDSLREMNPDIELVLIARHPGEYLDSFFGVRSIQNLEYQTKEESLGRWFRGLNPGDDTSHLRSIVDELESADLFIVGGDPFNELSMGFGWGLMPHATSLITLARFIGVPVGLYGIHMGRPLATPIGKEMTRYCVGNVDAITLREEFSRQVLAEMGIRTDHSAVLADPAFGLKPIASREPGTAILEKLDIRVSGKPVVGMNFRHQYWNWDTETWAHYREIVASFCDALVEDMDADILFIPNSNYELDAKIQLYQDDRPTNREIQSAMCHRERGHLVEARLDLTETLSLFPLLDLHISSRRHSLVFAALHGVPILAIGAGGKWHIGPAVAEMGVKDAFIELDDISLAALASMAAAIHADSTGMKERLLDRVAALREPACMHARELVRIAVG